MKTVKPKWNILYPEKEKDIKMHFRRSRYNNDVTSLNRLLNNLPKYRSGTKNSNKRPWSYASRNQFVAMKMRYSYNMKTHKAFLKQYLPQENKDEVKEKPCVFGSDEKEYKKNMAKKHFRFIISPESQDLPMELYIKEVVKEMEKTTGYSFHWQAAVHTDTPNIHAHVVINGFDKKGKEVFFDYDTLTRQFFDIASGLATNIVGERTREQMQATRDKWTVAKRVTEVDKDLLARLKDGQVTYRSGDERRRLLFLEELHLARFEGGHNFSLHADLESILAANGKYNVFLDTRSKYREELRLYDPSKMGELKGTIVEVLNQDDDKNWVNSLVIRDEKNKLYFVPTKRPEKKSAVNTHIVINKEEKNEEVKKPKRGYER